MAIKIARGTTGQADLLVDNLVERSYQGVFWGVFSGNGSPVGSYVQENNDDNYRNGWNLTEGGVVTIPIDAAPGMYSGEFETTEYVPGEEGMPEQAHYIVSEWEVVCMTVEINAVEVVNSDGSHTWTLTGAHQGGTAPYTDTFTKTGDGTLTGNALTLSPGQNATVTLNSGDSSNPACTATASRDFAGGAPPAGFQRVRCTNGNCESYLASTPDEGFGSIEECVASGCGGSGGGSGRYVCVNDECVYQSTTQAPYGFETRIECAQSGCGGGTEPQPCNLTGTIRIEDLGENRYRAVADLNGESTSHTVAWMQNGVAIPNETGLKTALSIVNPGTTSTFTAIVQDGPECVLALRAEVKNSDTTVPPGGGGVTGGRWLCVEGRCLLDPDAVSPTGDATRAECEARCGPAPLLVSSADCADSMGIYAKDIRWDDPQPGLEIYGAAIGIEVRPLCDNPACLYWVQIGMRTGTTLDGDYSDAAWLAHQLVTLQKGAGWPASGERIARHQRYGSVILDKPGAVLRMRQMWTPVYEMWPLATGAGSVVKIRETEPGKSLVFGTGPARGFTHASAANDLPRAGVLTALASLSAAGAGDATDCALLGDKLFVIRPGELFFIDLDSGQASMNYAPRGETRAPRFVETVGETVVALFVDAALSSQRTRCYDLSYAAPQLVWSMDDAVTLTNVSSDGQLLIAAGTRHFTSTGGTAAPTMAKDFASSITALAGGLIGLGSGEIWKGTGTAWTLKTQIGAPVGALANWFGDQDALHGLAGAASGANPERLAGELASGAWAQDRTLTVPGDLLPATVSGVTAMGRTSLQLEAASETQAARLDERMLIGSGASGLLFVYRLSNLSEDDDAFKACHDALPRLTPLYRPILTAAGTP